MARAPRTIFPGVALHVIQRGNNRNACFRVDSDYLTYLSYLRFLTAKYSCDVHAYCLMTNHVHLLLTPSESDACGYLFRDLGRCYVRYFNRRHSRTGTLWEGRFRSCLVESADYVIACHRYVELNPVRARMVDEPASYPWSSHAVNTGVGAEPMVRPHAEFLALSNCASPQLAYRGLFAQPLEETMVSAIREATHGGYPLASEAFKARAQAMGLRIERGKPGPRPHAPNNYDPDPEFG